MIEFRPLLAIISCLIGFIVLGIAIRAVSGTRRAQAAGTLFVYGLLFVGVALLLWRRVDHPATAAASEPPITEERVSAPAPKPEKQPDPAPEVPQTLTTDVEEPAPVVKHRNSVKPSLSQPVSDPIESRLPPEQRVYAVLSRGFVAIENWFDRFASPVASGSEHRTSAKHRNSTLSSNGLSFPIIQFAAGSAELTRDSQRALCELAERLTADKSSTIVEIRGHGTEDGPEAFRYLLSQARAQSVRDFLVDAGVDTRRLTTRALGSDQRDSTKADSQIEFVVRR